MDWAGYAKLFHSLRWKYYGIILLLIFPLLTFSQKYGQIGNGKKVTGQYDASP